MNVKKIYADYHQLLADPEVDAVYIATPPFLHKSMTIDALRAGKHVCCEKPFMLNQAEVREVIAVSKTVPHLKIICCSSRYHGAGIAMKARSMVASRELGELYHVSFYPACHRRAETRHRSSASRGATTRRRMAAARRPMIGVRTTWTGSAGCSAIFSGHA